MVARGRPRSTRTAAQSRSSAGRSPAAPTQVLRRVGRQVAGVAQQVSHGTAEAAGQVRQQLAEVADGIAQSVRDEAERLIEQQRDAAAAKVERVGRVVHQAAHALRAVRMDPIADAVDAIGEQADRAADYVAEAELRRVMADAGEIVDRHYGFAVGGLFLTGFAAVRFLKASTPQRSDDGRGGRSGGNSARGARGTHARNGRRG